MLNDFEFSFSPRNWSGGFPKSFTTYVMVLGKIINKQFNILDGLVSQASLSSSVLIKNELDSEITQLNSENLVII